VAKTKFNLNLSNVPTWQELRRYASQSLNNIYQQVNGGLNFKDNMDMAGPLTAVFTSTTSPLTISHSLGRVPIGFIEINTTAPMVVYAPQGASYGWTESVVYLQTTAVGTWTFFLM
jgi:hypothetical protein